MFEQIRSFLLPGFSVCMAALLMLCAQLGALDDVGKEKEEQRELLLKKMKRSAAEYSLSPAENLKQLFKFHENAIFRFSNPVTGAKDGALFIWSDRGRPQAILKLYTFDNEYFSHEWQSVSELALSALRDGKSVWNPAEPGISFREVPDAPKPADTATERLRQMKSMAGNFSATYTDNPRDPKPVELRLLVQPLFRYETGDDMSCLDGAIFGFANGTAPPALLILEARKIEGAHKWHAAFTRMATGVVAARYGEKEIYSVERYDFSKDPRRTFLWLPKQPVPKE